MTFYKKIKSNIKLLEGVFRPDLNADGYDYNSN